MILHREPRAARIRWVGGGREEGGGGEERGNGRKRKEGKKKKDSRARGGKEPASANGGVPQTETHSPELCNSLLKQSHPGTLSSLHPAGSPASAPDPSEPPERARTL